MASMRQPRSSPESPRLVALGREDERHPNRSESPAEPRRLPKPWPLAGVQTPPFAPGPGRLGRGLGPAAVLSLQRTHGNAHVQRLLAVQRRGATPGNCSPEERAADAGQQTSHPAGPLMLQRLWPFDDEETTGASAGDEEKSWVDQAADTVSEWLAPGEDEAATPGPGQVDWMNPPAAGGGKASGVAGTLADWLSPAVPGGEKDAKLDGGGGSIAGPAPPHQKDPFQLPSYPVVDPGAGDPEAVIHFPVDVDRLDPQDQVVLRDFAERHGDDIRQGRIRITIRGFADQRADDPYNQGLSERRAKQVDEHLRRELARQEIITARPTGYQSEVQAYGEVASDATPEALARSRRVEIHVERFDPQWAPDEEERQPGPDPSLGSNWRAKIVKGASGAWGLGGEGYELRIERVETGEGGNFAYIGGTAKPGKPSVDFAGESDWDYFTTDTVVRAGDFAGLASHGVASGPVAAGDVFVINYAWYEGGEMHYGEERLWFGEMEPDLEGPDASLSMGTLEIITLDL